MKILANIKSVEITRKVQHQDGTWGNVYGVTLLTGDDKILAESFRTDESLKKAGIVPGAIGTAILAFDVRPWTDKQGKAHYAQDIKMERFELANQNIRTGEAATEAAPAAEAVPAAPAAPAPQEPAGEQQGKSDLPF